MLTVLTTLARDVDRWTARIERAHDRALVSALNRTATVSRTRWSRAIRRHYRIPAKTVRARLRIERARRGRLQAELYPTRHALRARDYKPVRTRQGVRVRFRKSQPQVLEGAFIATTPNGRDDVFVRRSRGQAARRGVRRTVRTGAHRGKAYRPELPIDTQTLAYFHDLAEPELAALDRFAGEELSRQYTRAFAEQSRRV